MFSEVLVIVQVFLGIKCEHLISRVSLENHGRPDIVDIYTNYEDEGRVLRDYQEIYHSSRRSPIVHTLPNSNFEEYNGNSYRDRIDFHYPNVEFLTRDHVKSDLGDFSPASNDQFNFMNNDKVNDNGYFNPKKSRKPRMKIYRFNDSEFEYEPVKLSYVQKIPQLTSNKSHNDNTRYEEIATEFSDTSKNESTKGRINILLKKYLAKLYSKKYNSTSGSGIKTSSDFQLTSGGEQDASPKTKYFENNLWNAKKQKINKLFSLFTVVQFNNSQCNATSSAGSYLGICYTAQECSDLGGTAVGNCANSYGVCCVCKLLPKMFS
ncbi:hypothetical protein JTB14_025997 [Gonioctena quinquepunctata]|nr:hypothetical protein JTB14_025997 [Gonioctena quinquepunctata]